MEVTVSHTNHPWTGNNSLNLSNGKAQKKIKKKTHKISSITSNIVNSLILNTRVEREGFPTPY